MSDSLEVARTLRDKSTSPGIKDYWQRVVESIEKSRAEQKEK